jgi:putative hydrolase of the HAD superfamily
MILWDVDGVLLHSYNASHEFYWSMNTEHDLGVPTDQIQTIFGTDWHDVLRGRKDTRRHVTEVFESLGLTIPVERYIDYWLAKDLTINHDVLRHVTPINSCIATNQELLRAQVLQKLLHGHYTRFFASSHIGAVKPEDDYFRYIERDLDLPAAQLTLIDDTEANVAAARQRGWNAHLYTDPQSLSAFLSVT